MGAEGEDDLDVEQQCEGEGGRSDEEDHKKPTRTRDHSAQARLHGDSVCGVPPMCRLAYQWVQ